MIILLYATDDLTNVLMTLVYLVVYIEEIESKNNIVKSKEGGKEWMI